MDSKRQPLHVPLTNNERFVIIIAVRRCVLDTLLAGKTGKFAYFLSKLSRFRQFQMFRNPKPELDPAATLRRVRSAT